MKKTILEVYALAVCFFAVACFVVTLGIGLYDIVQIVAPEFTLNRYQYERYQSNDAFRAAPDAIPGKDEKERKALSEEEITRRREAGYAQALRAERHDGKQSLLSMAIIMLVDAIAFVIHWEIGKKARQGSA